MYKAERAHIGYAVYDANLHRDDQWRRSVRADFPAALVDGQLRLHYQPQYRLSSGRMVAVEALLRWEHPFRGLLTPESFLPSIQVGRTGNGPGVWMLRRACEDARGWMARMPRLNSPVVAVNLFPQDLTDGELPDLMMKVLHDTGLPGYRLQLEVTETALLADPVDAGTVPGARSAGSPALRRSTRGEVPEADCGTTSGRHGTRSSRS
jgi:EAL domain-containing protein (putative c-di-GMP-specific phosphodiesterase class I)